eukprot:480824_1
MISMSTCRFLSAVRISNASTKNQNFKKTTLMKKNVTNVTLIHHLKRNRLILIKKPNEIPNDQAIIEQKEDFVTGQTSSGNQETTTSNSSSTSQQQGASINTESSNSPSSPQVDTPSNTESTTSQPEATTSQPESITSQSEVATSQPEVITSKP